MEKEKEKLRNLRLLRYAAILFLLCFINGMQVQAATERIEGRVLFISSYSYAWDTVQIQIEGIQAGLGNGIVLDYEFMDTKRVNDETSEQQFLEGLKYRLSKVAPYNVVILGDDAALEFAIKYREELFDGIPLVFEGVNNEERALELATDSLITGVLEKLSVEKNIELGMKINPDATKVVAILDDSITGEAERKRFYKSAELYPQLEFSEINTSKLTTLGLQRAIRGVSEDSILIYVVMTEDASGKQYTNQESVQLIAHMAPVPAIRMVEGGIGEGLLGGNVVSMYKSGEIAAEIATDIILGKNTSEIMVVADSPNIYCVDEQVMKKFDVDMNVLPEGTTILNHEASFIERNKEALVPAGILIVLLLFIGFWILFDNHKRGKMLLELEEARSIMESASQHDFLTGLPNRSKFMYDLEEIIKTQVPCTVMMMDIDDFKQINDNFGHTAGDEALQQIANRLKDMQSQILTPYRFAGDEFILIIRSGQRKIVEKTAFQCRQLFGKPLVLAGEKRKVCGSIGIASYPEDTDNLEQLIVCADAAMYRVKKNGKNDFAFYQ